jgi:hypothetical protein
MQYRMGGRVFPFVSEKYPVPDLARSHGLKGLHFPRRVQPENPRQGLSKRIWRRGGFHGAQPRVFIVHPQALILLRIGVEAEQQARLKNRDSVRIEFLDI